MRCAAPPPPRPREASRAAVRCDFEAVLVSGRRSGVAELAEAGKVARAETEGGKAPGAEPTGKGLCNGGGGVT